MRRLGLAPVLLLAACHRTPEKLLPPPVFSPAVLASDDEHYGASEPSVVADSAGHVAVAWIDWAPPRPQIRFATSSNGGQSFSASRPMWEPDPLHGDGQADVSLALTSDGHLQASWLGCRHDEAAPTSSSCDIDGRTSEDMGLTWSEVRPIADGGHAHRERDWLSTDGTRIFASWTENLPGATDWCVAQIGRDGSPTFLSRLNKRASLAPLAFLPGEIDAYLLDRSPHPHTPTQVQAERRRSLDGGTSWSIEGTVVFDRSAALLPYSMGYLGGSISTGDEWLAIPQGSGESNDFVLGHRPPHLEVFRTAPSLRAVPGGRVGMSWIVPVSGGEMLAAWIEESPEGWRVMARRLLDERHRSRAVDVGGAPFQFTEASLTENIGDYLSVAAAGPLPRGTGLASPAAGTGEAVWVAWSDTRRKRAEIRVARGRMP